MTDEVHPDGLPTPRRYYAMLAIAIGIAMAVLDGTVVNVALPSIARELGATPSAAVWVINAYQLVIVALLLPLASMGERLGYRRVYQVGIALFTLGSLLCALSQSLPTLIAARVVQGVGGAALMSMNGALVRYTYPYAHLGRGIGLNGLVVSLSAAVAPSLAAGILAVGPWPWLFAVNVPFGLLNLWLALRFLPNSERAAPALRLDERRPQRRHARPVLHRRRRRDPRRGVAPGRPRHRRRHRRGLLPRAAGAGRRGPAYPGRPLPHPDLRPLGQRLDLCLCGLRHRLRGAALLFPGGARPRSGRDRPADDALAGGDRRRRAACRPPLRPHPGRHPRGVRHDPPRRRPRAPVAAVAGDADRRDRG